MVVLLHPEIYSRTKVVHVELVDLASVISVNIIHEHLFIIGLPLFELHNLVIAFTLLDSGAISGLKDWLTTQPHIEETPFFNSCHSH